MNFRKVLLILLTAHILLFAKAQNGPGGVSSDLILWLKSDAGVFEDAGTDQAEDNDNVVQWNDQAGSNNVAQDILNTANQPVYVETFGMFTAPDVFNGYPLVQFSPTMTDDDWLQTASTNFFTDNGDYTKIVVHSLFGVVTPSQNLVSAGPSGGGGFLGKAMFYATGMGGQELQIEHDFTNVGTYFVPLELNVASIATARYEGVGGNYLVGRDGDDASGTNIQSYTDGSEIQIGAFKSSGGLDGAIAEVVVFDNDISDANLQKVLSYLAIKYGMTLDDQDYVASDDEVVWDFSANSTYHNGLAGIARDNGSSGSSFEQLSSKANPTVATDIVSISTASFSADLTYFLWGNDNGSATATTATGAQSDRVRLQRIWKAQETGTGGDAGDLTLEFDISSVQSSVSSAGDVTLLVDGTDVDFSDVTPIAATSLVSNVVTFTGVNIADGDFFTIGLPPPPGPGGVSTDLVLWLKADADVFSDAGSTPAVDTDDVLQWNDQSIAGNHVEQIVDANDEPTFVTSDDLFNGKPYVTFDNSDWLETSSSDLIGNNGSYSKIVVHAIELAAARNNLISAGTGAGAGSHALFYDQDDQVEIFHNANVREIDVSQNTALQTSTLVSARYESGSPGNYTLGLDGNVSLSGTIPSFTDGAPIQIGNFISGNFGGAQIAEAILFNNNISDSELQKIWSYLALKYNMTLSTTDALATIEEGDYIASDDAVVWDFSLNNAYHNDVAGIARDNGTGGSDFSQSTAQSKSDDAILTVTADALSSDLQYFMWGNDDGALDATTTTGAESGRERLTRIWRAQESGTNGDVGNLTLEFDISDVPNVAITASDITLIIDDTDTDFSDATTVVSGASITNEVVTFTGVNIGNGDFFTLGFPIPLGPGGITTNLRMWLKADAEVYTDAGATLAVNNDAVQQWNDRSVSEFDVFQMTGGTQPIYQTDAINFNPALVFDGAKSMNSTLSGVIGDDNPYTKIVVHRYDNAFARNNLLSGGGGSTHAMWYDASNALKGSHDSGTSNFLDGGATTTEQYYIGSIRYDDTGSLLNYSRIDGEVVDSNTTNASFTDSGPIYVGSFNGTFRLNGQIAEAIVFDRAISDADAQIIDSYLGIKYGITLDQTSGGSDYFASSGAEIWDKDAAGAATYDNDIAGIGRDDATELSQTRSRSQNEDAIVTIDKGGSFDADFDFLVWGNDDGSTELTATGAETGRVRLTRIWAAQETGETGSLAIAFDLSNLFRIPNIDLLDASDFTLLVENAGDLDFSDVTPIAADSYTDLVVTFNGVDLADGDIFTIGVTTPGGPAGLSANLAFWLKADAGVLSEYISDESLTEAADGNAVVRWLDQTIGNQDFQQLAIPSQPSFVNNDANNLNFNPVVEFDDDFFGSVNTGLIGDDADYTKVVVHIPDEVSTDINNLLSSGGSGTHAMWYGTTGPTATDRLAATHTPPTNFITYDQAQSSSTPYIGIVRYDPSVENVISVNGDEATRNTTTDTFTDDGEATLIGAFGGGAFRFDGKMAEVILYNEGLSDANLLILQSYLALRYGITLDQTSGGLDYVASDGSTEMWDKDVSGATTYNNDIFGIGRDKTGTLFQNKSKSSNADGVITIANESISSPVAVTTDLTFLTIGNDNDDDGTIAEVVEGDLSGIDNRLDREWKVYTNASFTLEMEFDLTGLSLSTDISDFVLLVDRDGDGDFSTGDIDNYLPSGLSADILTVSGVVFETGDVFTLGTSRTLSATPGGVATSLAVWLKGDAGVSGSAPISGWADQSGNGNNATVSGAPSLGTGSSFNGNSFIDFDGSSDELTVPYDLNPVTNDPKQLFVVYELDNVDSEYGLLGNEAGSFETYLSSRGIAGDGLAFTGHQSAAEVASVGKLLSVVLDDPTPNSSQAFVDGVAQGSAFTYANADGGATSFNIGSTGNGNLLDGKIAEIIVYNDATPQTSAQRDQVHSYLGIKYGISLGHNYLDSDGATTWTTGIDGGAYDNQIFGIGRDDASALNQTNSSSTSGFVTIQSPAIDNDISYLIVGNNSGTLIGDGGANVPVGVESRLQRVWLAQQTESMAGTISIDLSSLSPGPTTGENLVLLLDSDADFSAGATIHSAGRTFSSGVVTFSLPDLSGSPTYFTVGSEDVLTDPLPVELIYFTATSEKEGIMVEWGTATETNNSHFEIETSYDTQDWELLAQVDGHGDSNESIEYQYLDNNSYQTGLYYRLKQVDFDGKYEHSNIVFVDLAERSFQFFLSPNPVTDLLTIETTSNIESIEIITLAGVTIHSATINKSSFSLRTSTFKPGIYIVLMKYAGGQKSVRTRIVKN